MGYFYVQVHDYWGVTITPIAVGDYVTNPYYLSLPMREYDCWDALVAFWDVAPKEHIIKIKLIHH